MHILKVIEGSRQGCDRGQSQRKTCNLQNIVPGADDVQPIPRFGLDLLTKFLPFQYRRPVIN